jgi:hypothetical protein
MTKKMDVTEQERQMIEILREWAGEDEYRLSIERQGGAWDITLSGTIKGKRRGRARGTGATFDRAWDSMSPLGR